MHDIFDEFKHQLPDIDPEETREWIDSPEQSYQCQSVSPPPHSSRR